MAGALNDDQAAAAVPEIRRRLDDASCRVPLVGDFHFNGHLLLRRSPECARTLDKYRINPGNTGKGAGAGAGANTEQVALYFAGGDQMHDFRTIQDHDAPHTSSDLLFKEFEALQVFEQPSTAGQQFFQQLAPINQQTAQFGFQYFGIRIRWEGFVL